MDLIILAITINSLLIVLTLICVGIVLEDKIKNITKQVKYKDIAIVDVINSKDVIVRDKNHKRVIPRAHIVNNGEKDVIIIDLE